MVGRCYETLKALMQGIPSDHHQHFWPSVVFRDRCVEKTFQLKSKPVQNFHCILLGILPVALAVVAILVMEDAMMTRKEVQMVESVDEIPAAMVGKMTMVKAIHCDYSTDLER